MQSKPISFIRQLYHSGAFFMNFISILFIILVICILTNSKLSLSYAAMGLELWFQKMIPTLLPFMILSGIMVRLKLTEKISMIIYPVIRPVFRVRKNVCYAMLMGFLCGFPMGAKVVGDLYSRDMITKREAEYLLSFCNNIGPVYFCGFVLPLLGRRLVLPYLFGMYGIPLLYGLALRYTVYRDLRQEDTPSRLFPKNLTARRLTGKPGAKALAACGFPGRNTSAKDLTACGFPGKASVPKAPAAREPAGKPAPSFAERLLAAVNDSVHSSVQSSLMLGGYMILFNLLNLLPHLVLGQPPVFISPLLEITGGLSLLRAALPLYSLLALSFGGISCIAQTYSCISQTDLSITRYVLHKFVLTLLNALFYLGWFLAAPQAFLL